MKVIITRILASMRKNNYYLTEIHFQKDNMNIIITVNALNCVLFMPSLFTFKSMLQHYFFLNLKIVTKLIF